MVGSAHPTKNDTPSPAFALHDPQSFRVPLVALTAAGLSWQQPKRLVTISSSPYQVF